MSKYDKEIDSGRDEYDKAIEPLERETHPVPPPPEPLPDNAVRDEDPNDQ
ncbi:MAG TPA: hypothetical protein VGF48_21930 [Thermoanaerobaculia bacterium]|jgi:hypothetical protein